MFHVAMYSSVIGAVGTALQQITGISDPIARVSNLGLLVPPSMRYIAYVAGVGTQQNRIQLQSPSLRVQPFPTFIPVNISTGQFDSIPRDHNMWDNPLAVDPYEELDVFAAQSTGAAATQSIAVIFADSIAAPVKGNFIRAHWTGTTTLTAGAWTACNITFDQALQVGNYAVVGGWSNSATGLAWRIVPPSGNVNRPGGLITTGSSDGMVNPIFRSGRLGQWMNFNSLTPPQIEFFATSADTAESGVLDLLAL